MNTVLFVNATIGFSENLFLVKKISFFIKPLQRPSCWQVVSIVWLFIHIQDNPEEVI